MLPLMQSELRSFARDIASESAFTDFVARSDALLPERLALLAELTGEDVGLLRHAFGRRLFERFVSLYPDFVPMSGNALDWLEHIEQHVHDELRGLYPEARPPQLSCVRVTRSRLLIRYWSANPVAEMCAGMIDAALAHFETRAAITRREAKDESSVFEVRLLEDA